MPIKKLYLIVFLTGAIVMILELIGSRVLAPYLGTSIYVWSSLIGVILGAMSAGYYIGGKIADKNPSVNEFSKIIFFSGISVFLILIFKNSILNFSVLGGVRVGSVIASFSLFALPAFLLGMVSPYAVRLAMEKIENSGKTVGNLYAVSTFGSIFGTFLAGFYLIPNFGSIVTLYGCAIALCLISFFSNSSKKEKLTVVAFMLVLIVFSAGTEAMQRDDYLVDEDSEYSHIQVYDSEYEGRKIRIIGIENFFDSGIYLDSDELLFNYTKYYRLDNYFNENIENAVMFGGAAYTVPKDFLKRNETALIDVVEIDPRTTEIAKEYFGLEENERLNIFHEDARIFLNRTDEENKGYYDVVYNDAFSSACAVPFHLATKEAVQKIYNILDEDGIYIMNLISPLEGKNSFFVRSEYKTIKSSFDNIYVFLVEGKEKTENQNIILIASKKEINTDEIITKIKNSEDQEKIELIGNLYKGEVNTDDAIILTDDFAPITNYVADLCKDIK